MTEDRSAARARQEVTRSILQALWTHRRRTGLAVLLLVVAKLLMVAVPAVLKRIVDVLSEPDVILTLPVFLLLGYALLRFAGSLFTELRDLVFVRVTQMAVADFRVRMFEHLHRLGARFHGARQTGVLSRDVERGTAGVGFLLGTALFTLLPTLVEIVSVLVILMAGYSLWFAVIVLATFSAYAVVTTILTERRAPFQRQINEFDSQASGRMVDSLLNYEAVKLYANEPLESRRLADILRRWVDVGIVNQRSLSTLHISQSAIIGFGVASVMLLAGQQVVNMQMTVGDLVLVNAYIIQICLPLNTLGLVFRQAKEAFINAERVGALLQVQPEVADDHGLPPLQVGEGAVEFDNVSFGYEPGRQILWNVSFSIPPGATVAVVGGSGSGKSTLARLLFRFYDPDEGRIVVDGQDLRYVDPQSLRRAVGIVPQDTLLFDETIAYNIAYSDPDATREAIIEAARGARVDDFISSLPAGYDTRVGERGIKLSGGERQRIAIARALLKNPRIMVFDEATSALDTRTERAIQAELTRISQGRSTLVIAHRLSTIVDADLILVMEHGHVVEQGTHDQLLERQGVYAQMWHLQRQQHALEAAATRLTMQPVNLVALVAGVLDAARPLLAAKGVNLYTQIAAEAARITGDPSALQQLIWNLYAHAVAVTPPGGRIELRLGREGPVTRLSIADGRLAPEEAAAQAAHEDEPEVLRSMVALNPAQAQAEAERLGGSLRAAAQPGAGMVFTLEFPLRAVDELPAAASEPAGIDLTGVSIMVADDQQDARDLVAEVLADRGAAVRTCASGTEVLAALSHSGADWPDLLVCDISLGDMEGYEVIGRIRSLEAERGVPLGARMPALALSGHTGAEYRLRALLAGFQIHVSKPVDPRELLATVSALLGRQRAGSSFSA